MIETLVERPNANALLKTQRHRGRQTHNEENEQLAAGQTADFAAADQRQHEQVIEAQASAALRNSSYRAVRRVSREVRNHVLTLRGRVPSFYMKQMAQTIVRHLLDGSLVLDNQLEVDCT